MCTSVDPEELIKGSLTLFFVHLGHWILQSSMNPCLLISCFWKYVHWVLRFPKLNVLVFAVYSLLTNEGRLLSIPYRIVHLSIGVEEAIVQNEWNIWLKIILSGLSQSDWSLVIPSDWLFVSNNRIHCLWKHEFNSLCSSSF